MSENTTTEINYEEVYGKGTVDQVIAHLYLRKPFYGFILNKCTRRETTEVPLAAGSFERVIMTNPKTFNILKFEEKRAVFEHEILHYAMLHFSRFYDELHDPETHDLANIALDCAINQYITHLPKDTVTVDTIKRLIGNNDVKEKESGDYYYNLLIDKVDEVKKQIAGDKALQKLLKKIAKGHKFSMKSGENKQGKMDPIMESAMRQLLHKAKEFSDEKQRQAGTEAGNYFTKILPQYINWVDKNVWKYLINKTIGSNITADKEIVFGKPSRRCPNSMYGDRHIVQNDKVYVGLDTSASVDDATEAMFWGVTSKALRSLDMTATMIQCDTVITDVKERVTRVKISREQKVGGRGGTDLTKILDYIEKKENGRPCRLVLLTDGETPWRSSKSVITTVIYSKRHSKMDNIKYGAVIEA